MEDHARPQDNHDDQDEDSLLDDYYYQDDTEEAVQEDMDILPPPSLDTARSPEPPTPTPNRNASFTTRLHQDENLQPRQQAKSVTGPSGKLSVDTATASRKPLATKSSNVSAVPPTPTPAGRGEKQLQHGKINGPKPTGVGRNAPLGVRNVVSASKQTAGTSPGIASSFKMPRPASGVDSAAVTPYSKSYRGHLGTSSRKPLADITNSALGSSKLHPGSAPSTTFRSPLLLPQSPAPLRASSTTRKSLKSDPPPFPPSEPSILRVHRMLFVRDILASRFQRKKLKDVAKALAGAFPLPGQDDGYVKGWVVSAAASLRVGVRGVLEVDGDVEKVTEKICGVTSEKETEEHVDLFWTGDPLFWFRAVKVLGVVVELVRDTGEDGEEQLTSVIIDDGTGLIRVSVPPEYSELKDTYEVSVELGTLVDVHGRLVASTGPHGHWIDAYGFIPCAKAEEETKRWERMRTLYRESYFVKAFTSLPTTTANATSKKPFPPNSVASSSAASTVRAPFRSPLLSALRNLPNAVATTSTSNPSAKFTPLKALRNLDGSFKHVPLPGDPGYDPARLPHPSEFGLVPKEGPWAGMKSVYGIDDVDDQEVRERKLAAAAATPAPRFEVVSHSGRSGKGLMTAEENANIGPSNTMPPPPRRAPVSLPGSELANFKTPSRVSFPKQPHPVSDTIPPCPPRDLLSTLRNAEEGDDPIDALDPSIIADSAVPDTMHPPALRIEGLNLHAPDGINSSPAMRDGNGAPEAVLGEEARRTRFALSPVAPAPPFADDEDGMRGDRRRRLLFADAKRADTETGNLYGEARVGGRAKRPASKMDGEEGRQGLVVAAVTLEPDAGLSDEMLMALDEPFDPDEDTGFGRAEVSETGRTNVAEGQRGPFSEPPRQAQDPMAVENHGIGKMPESTEYNFDDDEFGFDDDDDFDMAMLDTMKKSEAGLLDVEQYVRSYPDGVTAAAVNAKFSARGDVGFLLQRLAENGAIYFNKGLYFAL
ncbi:hypothetical protein HDU96_000324 [Phlyctochytrium bullatum]|nr:hypothetical protein HDU96_000324 [Phlyctochytrium bullatum]